MVHLGLTTELCRNVELLGQLRVATRNFIDAGSPVTHVLPSQKDGHLDMKLEVDHLKGGRMSVTEQVANQTTITPNTLGAFSIRNAGGLNYGVIKILPRHCIDKTYEPMLFNTDF
jgi:hypothetical protein